MDQNRSLLNSLFKFKPSSELCLFLTSKTGVKKTIYSLEEILTLLKNIIHQERLFDARNPSLIMCSEELEKTLNVRHLHVSEIRNCVLKHLVKIDNEAFISRYYRDIGQPDPNNGLNNPRPASAEVRSLIHKANMSTNMVIDKKAQFTCKPKFLLVLRSLAEVDNNKTVFSYEEVTNLISIYILNNRQKFFDKRNVKIAFVENDLLGEAFDLSAFHRCQLTNLIRKQIIPISPDTDKAVVMTSGSPGCMITIRERPATQAIVSESQN